MFIWLWITCFLFSVGRDWYEAVNWQIYNMGGNWIQNQEPLDFRFPHNNTHGPTQPLLLNLWSVVGSVVNLNFFKFYSLKVQLFIYFSFFPIQSIGDISIVGAARNDYTDTVHLLVKKGADVNQSGSMVGFKLNCVYEIVFCHNFEFRFLKTDNSLVTVLWNSVIYSGNHGFRPQWLTESVIFLLN